MHSPDRWNQIEIIVHSHQPTQDSMEVRAKACGTVAGGLVSVVKSFAAAEGRRLVS